jgi:hypothetical protein
VRLRAFPLLLLTAVLGAQTKVGELLYADPVGQGIRLVVVDGGAPGWMTIAAGTGTVEQVRKRVLTFSGPERFQAGEAQVLAGDPPVAWRVAGMSGGSLVRAGTMTYWRYRPGRVLLAGFRLDGRDWTLQSAELPDRLFHP